jgi:hypothetical protein
MSISLENTKINQMIQSEMENEKETARLQDVLNGTDAFSSILNYSGRSVCNGCGEVIKANELEKFSKNGGYCSHCDHV